MRSKLERSKALGRYLNKLLGFAIYPTYKRAVVPRHLVKYERGLALSFLQDNAAIIPLPGARQARRRKGGEGNKINVPSERVIFCQMPI